MKNELRGMKVAYFISAGGLSFPTLLGSVDHVTKVNGMQAGHLARPTLDMCAASRPAHCFLIPKIGHADW